MLLLLYAVHTKDNIPYMGQDRIWIEKEQMFVKKELNVADTYTSLIIKTQNCVIIASTKIFYIYI